MNILIDHEPQAVEPTDEYLRRIEDADVEIVLGPKIVPVTHQLGPITETAGGNRWTGGGDHALGPGASLLTPAELHWRCTVQIPGLLTQYRQAGVRKFVPYALDLCCVALRPHGGHEPLGVELFFRQWDQYERFLGPPPPGYPTEWLCRDAAAKRLDSKTYGGNVEYFSPAWRGALCHNNPHVQAYHRIILAVLINAGHTAAFGDNWYPQADCECRYCQLDFHAHTGYDLLTYGGSAAKNQWRRQSVVRHAAGLRRFARSIVPDFALILNTRGLTRFGLAPVADYVLEEHVDAGNPAADLATLATVDGRNIITVPKNQTPWQRIQLAAMTRALAPNTTIAWREPWSPPW